MATEKLDLYIVHKDEYVTPKTPQLVIPKKLKTILRMPVSK